jgi:hypothetical protein
MSVTSFFPIKEVSHSGGKLLSLLYEKTVDTST